MEAAAIRASTAGTGMDWELDEREERADDVCTRSIAAGALAVDVRSSSEKPSAKEVTAATSLSKSEVLSAATATVVVSVTTSVVSAATSAAATATTGGVTSAPASEELSAEPSIEPFSSISSSEEGTLVVVASGSTEVGSWAASTGASRRTCSVVEETLREAGVI